MFEISGIIYQVLKDEEKNQRKLILLFAKEARPPVNVNAVDKYGSTALHMATYKGNFAAVRDLLECNADFNVSISINTVWLQRNMNKKRVIY